MNSWYLKTVLKNLKSGILARVLMFWTGLDEPELDGLKVWICKPCCTQLIDSPRWFIMIPSPFHLSMTFSCLEKTSQWSRERYWAGKRCRFHTDDVGAEEEQRQVRRAAPRCQAIAQRSPLQGSHLPWLNFWLKWLVWQRAMVLLFNGALMQSPLAKHFFW